MKPALETQTKLRILFIGNYLKDQVSHQASYDVSQKLAMEGLEVIRTSSFKDPVLRLTDMLFSVLFKHYHLAHLDLFSGRAVFWAYLSSTILKLRHIPFVVTLHGGGLPEHFKRNPKWITRILQQANAVTAPSAFLARAFTATVSDIHTIPNPLEVAHYKHKKRKGPPIILWCRAFDSLYQPELAVETFAKVKQRFPDIHMLMAGPIKNRVVFDRTQDRLHNLGLQDSITLLGPIPKPQIPKVFGQAHIFLNTTQVDNTPVSIMEAMASGLAVVSTRVGGIPDLVKSDRYALLCHIDADSLAQAICHLLDNPKEIQRMGMAAQKYANHWDWSNSKTKWLRLFGNLAKSKR